LIPTLFLILGWGYQPERFQAGIYLLFYTLLASLPLLVGILFVYNSLGLGMRTTFPKPFVSQNQHIDLQNTRWLTSFRLAKETFPAANTNYFTCRKSQETVDKSIN